MKGLILFLYALPAAFFAAYLDYTERSMAGLGLALLLYITLGGLASVQRARWLVFLGTGLTALSSYGCAALLLPPESDGYFKPLTRESLVALESVLFLLPQLLGWQLGNMYKRRG